MGKNGPALLLESGEPLLLETGEEFLLEKIHSKATSAVFGTADTAHGMLLAYICRSTSGFSSIQTRLRGDESTAASTTKGTVQSIRERGVNSNTVAKATLETILPLKVWTPKLAKATDRRAMHKLLWESDESTYVVFDGEVFTNTTAGEVNIDDDYDIRDHIILVDETGSFYPIPADRVDLTMSADSQLATLERKKDGGSYSIIRRGYVEQLIDGPLQDGTYTYKLTVFDDAGNQNAAEASFDINGAPEPPTSVDLSHSISGDTVNTTISWTESVSDDIDHYNVYKSGSEGNVPLDGDPEFQTATNQLDDAITEEGVWRYLVRAVDTTGQEESNITQLVTITYYKDSNNDPVVVKPADPVYITATALAGGKAEIKWAYDPANEIGGIGVAEESRIYYDNGTGTVDYSSPLATVAMDNPTNDVKYNYTTGVLPEDTYKFVVRVATKAHPNGIETDNTGYAEVTTDATPPDAPSISGEII